MKPFTNSEWLGVLQKTSKTFKSETAHWTAEIFSEKGFEALRVNELDTLNEFYDLSLRVVLNEIEAYNGVDPLAEQDFGVEYANPMGAMLQRIAIKPIKPVNPAFKEVPAKYGSVDPFITRRPESTERFFRQNNNYQNFVTIWDSEVKTIFISETGMYDWIAGVLQSLDAGYKVQTYVNKLETLNKLINSVKYPLLETQKIQVTMGDNPTEDELKTMLLEIKNVLSTMKVEPALDGFNAGKFSRKQNLADLRLLIRPQLRNLISTEVLATIFNPEELNLNVKIVEVSNFGGIEYYNKNDLNTPLKPVYDEVGVQIGFNATGTGEPLSDDDIVTKDPNENILCVLADRGVVFTSTQNGYTVEQIRNPRGAYRNYWCNLINGIVAGDYCYTLVTFNKVTNSNKKDNAKKDDTKKDNTEDVKNEK